MQGHQQKRRQTNTSSNNKDKYNTIIETSTTEDHDDENLHNPSTRPRYSPLDYVVVVFFTLTDRASTIPSNIRGCQSGTRYVVTKRYQGQRVTSWCNPLLRPTGIQIATKSYATLQAMAPTNSKTVHQTSFTPYREQPRSTRIVVAYPRPAFSATNLFMCVFFPSILDIKFVGRTSRGHTGRRSHGVSHPSSFCGACLHFSREKDSAIPFPRRP